MNKPLVSVLMPCYNAEKYVEEAILSILNQSYSNLEVIAINDCSQDDTSEILHKIAKQDNRVKVFDNEVNLKLIKTLNKGISLCNGELIARMDSDDISLPDRVKKEVDFLEQNVDYDIVSTQFATFRANSSKTSLHTNPTKHEELQAYMLFKCGICHPAVMIRKRVFTELGLKFEANYLHVEDYALWSEAIYLTKIGNIGGDPLLLYRVHESQVSSLHEELQIENKKKVFRIHCKHLGLNPSDELIDIYSSVAESVPSQSSFDYLSKCESFIMHLINQNKKENFCSQSFLEGMMALHWIRLCANSRLGLKVLKKCLYSPLFKKEYYSIQDFIILAIKCTFRLRYKKSLIYKIVFR